MSLNHQDLPPENIGQSPGCDPKTTKRNSGLFAFLKWFKPSTSRESIDADLQNSHSSSCDSLNSTNSNGTVASFSYIPPSAYINRVTEKCIILGPETDTYKARLKQRDKRRENDKNLTLRKKYNLFFNRETLLKPPKREEEEENTKSLPLMTRTPMEVEEEKTHRRTNSESSKTKKAGAYLHVKGKRKAPQPPGLKQLNEGSSTMSLRRKKRLAPPPPAITAEKIITTLKQVNESETIKYADAVIFNDSLKLDHGILKPAKEALGDQNNTNATNSPNASARSSYVEAPVSPRPWYKRNTSRVDNANKKEKESQKSDHKYEPIERLPEVQFMRNSTIDLTLEDTFKSDKKKVEEKRKSAMSFLTNISELDREATEIIKKEHQKNGNGLPEIPPFMRPKEEAAKINTDSWVSPKRRSAKDLIAKFNAITNVTKVTVNTAFFGSASQKDNSKRDYFGKRTSLNEDRKQENLLESHKKRIEQIEKKSKDDNAVNSPLMKSESASAIKPKPETPKSERKVWNCPKCSLENEYWRIICHVCSAIKPYFDDLGSPSSTKNGKEAVKTANDDLVSLDKEVKGGSPDKVLERSKTQIGFSALASYNLNRSKKIEKTVAVEEKAQKEVQNKNEEREKLKKMLIEMKNSLPKRKSNILMKQNSRASIIVENPDNDDNTNKEIVKKVEETDSKKTQEEKVAEILIGTTETIYENIKVKKTDNLKPIKVSSSAQTSSVFKKVSPPKKIENKKASFELMRPKDFENIYSDTNGQSPARIYANLARNDELSLFFNMPKNFNEIKNNITQVTAADKNKDTIEINRLLRRLESSIAKGELTEASIYAKELAQLKVNCSVIRQKPQNPVTKKQGFNIEMYVEDKISHRGPFPIEVTENQTVAELKLQVEQEFEIPVNVQRWILGKELASDDNATLKDHNITTERCPVFLYLVAPDAKINPISPGRVNKDEEGPSTSKSVLKDVKTTENVEATKLKISKAEQVDLFNKENQEITEVKTVKNEENEVKNTSQIKLNDIKKDKMVQENEDRIPKIVEVIPKVAEPARTETAPSSSKTNITFKSTTVMDVKLIQNVASKVEIGRAQEMKTQIAKKSVREVKTIQNVEPKIESNRDQFKARGETSRSSFIETKPVQTETLKPETSENQFEFKSENTRRSVVEVAESQNNVPEEDFEDYDTNTLKPQAKEWECHLCTLLNPLTSNVCAVCATVRQKETASAAPKKSTKKRAPQPNASEASSSKNKEQTYLQLVNLDNADLVESTEAFECAVCFLEIQPGDGVTLRECLHQFCKICLAHTIEYTEDAEVKCPYRDNDYSCNIALQDREIKALVTPQLYDQYLAKSVAEAENKIGKSFHCKTPDCRGWCIFEDNVNEFRCPVCRRVNCLTCQAIHGGMNCKQYQEKMNQESEVDEDAKRTKEMVDEMVRKGEALTCPTCQVILMKKWGCDWVRCSMCKTEICWVTRGPRWGPGGKGDTSGGCQCGVNGVKCHPQCSYCH